MASRADHLFIDERHLRRTLNEVHGWLDYFYQTEGGGHRSKRHHQEGVEEVRARWGDDAAKSAELHIRLDMGWVPTMADWAKRDSSWMDTMGRRVEYLRRYPDCDDEQISMAWTHEYPCEKCGRNTEQRIILVIGGHFRCSACKGRNYIPDYRMD
jgi:hypothetical protein